MSNNSNIHSQGQGSGTQFPAMQSQPYPVQSAYSAQQYAPYPSYPQMPPASKKGRTPGGVIAVAVVLAILVSFAIVSPIIASELSKRYDIVESPSNTAVFLGLPNGAIIVEDDCLNHHSDEGKYNGVDEVNNRNYLNDRVMVFASDRVSASDIAKLIKVHGLDVTQSQRYGDPVYDLGRYYKYSFECRFNSNLSWNEMCELISALEKDSRVEFAMPYYYSAEQLDNDVYMQWCTRQLPQSSAGASAALTDPAAAYQALADSNYSITYDQAENVCFFNNQVLIYIAPTANPNDKSISTRRVAAEAAAAKYGLSMDPTFTLERNDDLYRGVTKDGSRLSWNEIQQLVSALNNEPAIAKAEADVFTYRDISTAKVNLAGR